MKTLARKTGVVVGLLLLVGQSAISRAEPMGAGFTYQGWLTEGDEPAEGLYDFRFELFDAPTAGNQVGPTLDANAVEVVDGYFTAELDFISSGSTAAEPEPLPMGLDYDKIYGLTYDKVYGGGEGRWLEIAVRRASGPVQAFGVKAAASAVYTILLPRQKLTPVPYALYALNGGSAPGSAGPADSGGLYDVLRWSSSWDLPPGETAKPAGDAGGQNLFNVGKLGIGPYLPDPAERLDLSWTGGVNARIGRYNYLGSCHSSATFVLGNNARARTDAVNGIVVGQPHDSYGYRAITLGSDGIVFHAVAGKVAPGDPVATARVRITNDGNVGIGTTTPGAKLDIESGTGTYPSLLKLGNNVPGDVKARHYVYLGSGYGRSHGITLNYDRDSGKRDVANFSAIDLGLGVGGSGQSFPGGGFFFHYMPPASSSWATAMHINHETGNVGIGTTSPTEKLDVDGAARLRKIASGSGTAVVVDQNGKLWKQSSSQRYKRGIRDLADDSDTVLRLRPVRFQWTTTGEEDIGLIAEEVAESIKDLVIYDAEGRPEAVKYDRVALYLLSVVKVQRQRIAELEAAQAANASLARRVEALEQIIRQQRAVAKEVQP
jgi:hypothetical protein